MPVHDWTRVDASVFHSFHLSWIVQIKAALNLGLLPEGYYAMTEREVDVVANRPVPSSLAIRHVESGHRLVTLSEIISPANKDQPRSVETLVGKVHGALGGGCNVLLIDLFPPGAHDPRGLHGAIWDHFGPDEDAAPADRPVTLASYRAGAPQTEAYVENVGVGDDLPAMPLFLDGAAHVKVPLEPTYRAAYRGLPAYWRGVIEGR